MRAATPDEEYRTCDAVLKQTCGWSRRPQPENPDDARSQFSTTSFPQEESAATMIPPDRSTGEQCSLQPRKLYLKNT